MSTPRPNKDQVSLAYKEIIKDYAILVERLQAGTDLRDVEWIFTLGWIQAQRFYTEGKKWQNSQNSE